MFVFNEQNRARVQTFSKVSIKFTKCYTRLKMLEASNFSRRLPGL